MNNLSNFMKKKPGRSFRKRLGVFNYKVNDGLKQHKKPGVIPIELKQKLLKDNSFKSIQKIKYLEKISPKVLGTFTRYGNFKFDSSKLPIYNVPDMEGFEVY